MHSNRETGAYVNIGWWSGPQAYLPVLRSPEMAADAKTMAVHAEVKGGLYKAVVDSARTEVASRLSTAEAPHTKGGPGLQDPARPSCRRTFQRAVNSPSATSIDGLPNAMVRSTLR